MFALTRFEIKKMVALRRSWVGFLTIVLINGLFALGFYLQNRRHGNTQVHGMRERLVNEFINAFAYTQVILSPCMFLLFPMILGIIGSHLLAGEMEVGSLRMVLCRSVSRWEVVAAKFVALCGYSGVMLVALLPVSYGVSACLFKPMGDVIIFGQGMFLLPKGIIVLPQDQALTRIYLSYLLAWPMLASVSAMALMFSLLTRHVSAAAILTTAVYFCSYIVCGIPLLSAIHPFMPTRYLPFFRYALMPEIPWNTIGLHAVWTAGFTVAFLGIAVGTFNLQDL